MTISYQLERIIRVLDEINNTKSTGYGMTIEDKVEFISKQLKTMAENGFGQLPVHIASSDDYDHETGEPTIDNPEENVFYLVPTGEDSDDMFEEWVYTNGKWEHFGAGGSVKVPQSDWAQTNTNVTDYIKNKPAIKAGEGDYSIQEGTSTTASGAQSHAEGFGTTASGVASHAEGSGTKAFFQSDHAEGTNCTAGIENSGGQPGNHAEGYECKATGGASHAEGSGTKASATASHAEGFGTTASGVASHAEGISTIASGYQQHVFGKFNINDVSDATPPVALNTYVEIVGNGSSANARSNARTLDWSGNEWLAGNLTAAGGSITIGSTTITEAQLQALLASLS